MADKQDKEPEVVTPTEALQSAQRRAAQEEMAAGPQEKRDETESGGRFMVDGRLVNADGEPIDEGKKGKK